MKRLPLAASFLLFIALCASAAYWGMQLFKPPLRPVAAPPRVAQAEVRTEPASALFGGRRGNVAVASNYQLKGVIFSGNPKDSVAIVSADGKPAQAIRVDMEIVPGVTVKEVHREYVLLSENGATKRVELPEESRGQDSPGISPQPTPPSMTPPPRQPIPSRVQAAPPVPAPVTPPAATTTIPGQMPVPGQTPIPQTQPQAQPQTPVAGQLPGQVTGQVPGQVPQTTTAPPVTGVPPTVVVSPPPSGQSGTVPGAATAPQNVPVAPQTYPGTTGVPGTQQVVPGVPATR